MNADLVQATQEIGIDDKDVAKVARARKRPSGLVLALVGILVAVVSFIVGYAFPAQNDPEPEGYPYASLGAATLVASSGKRLPALALVLLMLVGLISFGVGALLGDAFFGFGATATYSVCSRDQLEARTPS